MKTPSPYRSLPVEKRVTLVMRDIDSSPASKERYVRLVVARGGGFRLETVRKRSSEQLAKEVVRYALETSHDEFGLLQALYVELEPALQVEFLDAAGVRHEAGIIAEELEPPFADASTVRVAAHALYQAHGDDARRYLRTIALYNGDAWPGIGDVLGEFSDGA